METNQNRWRYSLYSLDVNRIETVKWTLQHQKYFQFCAYICHPNGKNVIFVLVLVQRALASQRRERILRIRIQRPSSSKTLLLRSLRVVCLFSLNISTPPAKPSQMHIHSTTLIRTLMNIIKIVNFFLSLSLLAESMSFLSCFQFFGC